MTFIANHTERRTLDPARELELFDIGGGPDYRKFKLQGSDGFIVFNAFTESKPIESVDQSLSASVSKILIWRVVGPHGPMQLRSMEETRQLITEALTAFIGIHGYPTGQAVQVEFTSTFGGRL